MVTLIFLPKTRRIRLREIYTYTSHIIHYQCQSILRYSDGVYDETFQEHGSNVSPKLSRVRVSADVIVNGLRRKNGWPIVPIICSARTYDRRFVCQVNTGPDERTWDTGRVAVVYRIENR